MPLEQKDTIVRREAIVLHPFTDSKVTYFGDEVFDITDKGIIIATGGSRHFFPWSRVTRFSYHTDDKMARGMLQGF